MIPAAPAGSRRHRSALRGRPVRCGRRVKMLQFCDTRHSSDFLGDSFMRTLRQAAVSAALLGLFAFVQPVAGLAQGTCKNRGELDAMYCDANKDMVADAPTDPKKWKNPSTIVFTYTPVEDPAVYENIFKPFTTHLAKCLDKKVVFYQVQINAAEIEAMRSGRLHVGGFSTGPTAFAVNLAGAVPFAVKGNAKEFQGYNLIVDREGELAVPEARRPQGQEGRAHVAVVELRATWRRSRCSRARASRRTRTTRSSSPASTTSRCMGVDSGDYDAAPSPPTSSTAWRVRGQIKEADFRIIYRSQKFPTSSFAYAHDLDPEARRQDARLLLRLPLPAGDGEGVRRRRPLLPDQLQDDVGSRARRSPRARAQAFDKAAYDKETKREAEREAAKARRRRHPRRWTPCFDARAQAPARKSYVAGKPVLDRHQPRDRARAASPRSSAPRAPARAR